MKKQDSGFTLIELMLVVAIIATLVAMIAPKFTGRSEEARQAAAKADIEAGLASALDMYELDSGFYPTEEQGLEALSTKPSADPVPLKWKGPYVKKKNPKDPWGRPYVYQYPGTHNKEGYDLSSLGPDGAEGGGDDITNWEE